MKTLPTSPENIKLMYDNGEPYIVYTCARLKFANDATFLELTPDKFKISGNEYTENGGSDFPIGIALCKTITINIDNTDGSLDDYTWEDWYGCEIYLYSRMVFRNTNTTYDIFEGIFYVNDIPNNLQFITIKAADFMTKTEVSTQVYTNWQSHLQTINLFDYFYHICLEIAAEVYGSSSSASDVYASHLNTDRFTNSTVTLGIFPTDRSELEDRNNNVTYRDILSYIAQLAGGNAVVVYEEINGNVVPKIDIKEYDFSQLEFDIISARAIPKQVDDIIDCGYITDTTPDTIDCGNVSSVDYIMLGSYTQHPEIEFADVQYTDIRVLFPQSFGSSKYLSRRHTGGPNPTSNELVLKNPVLTSAPNATPTAIVDTLYYKLCLKDIRPFSGNFTSQPLAEFMDNVVVVSRKGDLYNSFITGITYNYFGQSNIRNSVPNISKNNSKYYKSWG